MAIGYEVVIRLGLAMSPEMTQDRGFHVTSAFGPLGAAAISLRGLGAERASSALAIAAAQSGGTTGFARSGGEVKRLHASLAASSGIRAADLAALGITAQTWAIQGPRMRPVAARDSRETQIGARSRPTSAGSAAELK
jgi:2-methylcitrate dehydratase PrpD